MAVFYQLLSRITRGTFTCAIATAAYRSGSNLKITIVDKKSQTHTEHQFDYSKKSGIVYSTILAPSSSPDWVFDRQKLWMAVEDREKKYNALLAREYTVALPEELTPEQNIELINEFTNASFISRGMIADINFHNEHHNNPHLHIMCPTRPLSIIHRNKYNFSHKRKDWGSKEVINLIRQEQAHFINKYLEKYGHGARVSHIPDRMNRFECLRPWL